MPTFVPGTIAALTAEYSELGRGEDLHNRPPSHATVLDQHEAALKAKTQVLLMQEQANFDSKVVGAGEELSNVEQRLHDYVARTELMLSDSNTEAGIAADLATQRPGLVKAMVNRLKLEQELNDFRYRNKIDFPASYPDNGRRMKVVLFSCFTHILDAYISETRSYFMGDNRSAHNDYLFANAHGAARYQGNSVRQCLGLIRGVQFSTHNFRHLCGTIFVNAEKPQLAADLLGDTLETTIRSYTVKELRASSVFQELSSVKQ
jgi:hypothetical protein